MSQNNSSSIITLLGLVLGIYAICNAEQIKEGFAFGVGQGVLKVDRTTEKFEGAGVDIGPRGAPNRAGQTSLKGQMRNMQNDGSNYAQPMVGRQQSVQNVYASLIGPAPDSQENFEQRTYNYSNQRQNMQGVEAAKIGEFYEVPGTYQASLNPRFENFDHGAHIKYNMPPQDLRAAPANPLTFSNMIQENYVNDSIPPRGVQYQNGPIAPANYAAGNFNELMQKAHAMPGNPEFTDKIRMTDNSPNALPMRDMTSVAPMGSTGDGGNMQPIVYDRFIVANLKSQQAAQGDFIRGDLPIVPNNNGWFNTSYAPQKDLNQGAMAVLGGIDGTSAQTLADLINAASGGTKTTQQGKNLAPFFEKQQMARRANIRARSMNSGNREEGDYTGAPMQEGDYTGAPIKGRYIVDPSTQMNSTYNVSDLQVTMFP